MAISSKSAYTALKSYKPRSSQTLMDESEKKYEIPARMERLSSLRGLVGNLSSAVEAVDPSVTGRTSGTFTTEGQRQALVSKERTPILGDLSKQQGFLGEEQAGLTTAQSLSSQMASALMNEDQTTYQRLLDQYNAASASEQAAEAKRQFQEGLKLQREQLAESKRAASMASSGGGGYDISSLLQGSGKSSAPKTDPDQQWAYNNVKTRINSGADDKALLSDFLATAKSAQRGNKGDLYKLQVYRKFRPDLFSPKVSYSWEKTGGSGGSGGW